MPDPLHVLMIEDNEDDAFFELKELRRAGFELEDTRVESEQSLRAALARQPWDLILCDFTLPGFGGAQALRIAKEEAPETPFIFVSGTIGEEAVAEAMRSGAQDYVMKDRLKRLVPAVRRELREAAARREAKHAERSMRESEHKYRQLFDALTDAVFLVEEERGRVIDTNRQAEHVLERERSLIVGQPHTVFLASPGSSPVLAELRSAAANPDRGGCSLHLLRPGAGPVPVHASASRIELYGRSLLLVLIHPNNPRRERAAGARLGAEEILAEVRTWPSEALERLASLLDDLRDGLAAHPPGGA